MRSRIKICGITTPEMAEYVARCGADAIGLMFYPQSIRYIDLQTAQNICQAIPPLISKVAVMVNPTADFVHEMLGLIQIDYLQFHGEQSNEFYRSFGKPFIKAIQVDERVLIDQYASNYPDACAFLLDSNASNRHGGSGVRFDWRLTQQANVRNLILAGGLNVDNVAEAMKQTNPYALDVSSGVETAGVKDKHKIKQFCDTVIAYQK